MGNIISSLDFKNKKYNLHNEFMYKCGKCNGRGHIPQFSHIAGGVCFNCSGKGKTTRKTTSYEYCHSSINNTLKSATLENRRWYVCLANCNGVLTKILSFTDESMKNANKRVLKELVEVKKNPAFKNADWDSVYIFEGELKQKLKDVLKQLKLN
jgi:RecJ-like exonuclease